MVGGEAVFDFASMSVHCAASLATSRPNSSSLAPSDAVRTITPASSGTTAFKIVFRRERSRSGSLREIPVIGLFGT